MKKKIKVYMLATQSPGSSSGYTLDEVYCFPTHEKRRDFMEKISGSGVVCDCFDDEMEVDV